MLLAVGQFCDNFLVLIGVIIIIKTAVAFFVCISNVFHTHACVTSQ